MTNELGFVESNYVSYVFDNAAMATHGLLDSVSGCGREISVRGQVVRELNAITTAISNPEERFMLLPARKPNYFAAIAESLWVLSGRNDVQWLSYYLKRAPDFSDDGEVWRGGYGPRLRRFRGNTDQLAQAVELLKKDKNTRRCVLSIYDGGLDLNVTTLDTPCNDLIQFIMRDNYLDMYVYVRSQDLIWGFSGINTFEWSMLHGLVSDCIGVKMGVFVQFCGSEHYYPRYDKLVEDILSVQRDSYNEIDLEPTVLSCKVEGDYISLFDSMVRCFFSVEEAMRKDVVSVMTDGALSNFGKWPGWQQMFIALAVYIGYKSNKKDWVRKHILGWNEAEESGGHKTDLLFAVNEFFLRKSVISHQDIEAVREEDYTCGLVPYNKFYKGTDHV